ncbi:hypothetical protein OEB99_13100 [Actinotalea sp. M2MS4P-6]|uniref:hypothetical protein n=1 Tax=Actinotalea sp. M2MS4P-6 TaxID=2983762 RepID=UPI0021E38CFC|nr:hypothetical protein [Actinotalea sp. M2MS4P-6]MCV2395249.1 hypothetical protein [Actinotalea sp. M2MS4P-6]
MASFGLVAALLGGVVVVGLGVSWGHGFSGAHFRPAEALLAIGVGLVLGSSLVSASLLALVAPPAGEPGGWLHTATVSTGVAAVGLGLAWAVSFRHYINWSIRRRPEVFNGRGWHDFPPYIWAAARWLPPALLIFGGSTLLTRV